MRDEKVSEPSFLLKRHEKVQNLCLDRDIECGHGLVAHDKLRGEGKGSSNTNPLTLPARKLMGETTRSLGLKADPAQEIIHALGNLPRRPHAVVDQGLCDKLAHGHARVERGERVLEYGLHPLPDGLQLPVGQACDVLAPEQNAARRRLQKPENQPRRSGLSAPTLPNHRERLTAVH